MSLGSKIVGKENGMYTKNQKAVSIAVCILLVFVTFASLFYIAKEERHDCTGEDCPICSCIHQAEQLLKNIGTDTSAIANVNLLPLFVTLLFTCQFLLFCSTSLVSKKVRLND